jgi:hypothetical protein
MKVPQVDGEGTFFRVPAGLKGSSRAKNTAGQILPICEENNRFWIK